MNSSPPQALGERCDSGSPWAALESIRGQAAVAWSWRKELGGNFDWFSAAFLVRGGEPVRSYPCPRGCGCAHEVITHGAGDVEAVCCCERGDCDPIRVPADDLVPWGLSWRRLGRALSKAFGLSAVGVDLGLPRTWQVGSWSADAVPVVLTVQLDSQEMRRVIQALVARFRQPFILMAPSAQHLDATSKELLGNVGASFFALNYHLFTSLQGTLRTRLVPGDLFAKFTPHPKEPIEEDEARKAFALVKALDCEQRARKASLYTVFRLYCVEGLNAVEVARRCQCTRAVIFRRLRTLTNKLGVPARSLRQYSTHFDQMEASLSDGRARRIYRKGAAYGEEAEEED